MTIPPEREAQILRYHHVEKWSPATIARHLNINRGTVMRVLAQAGKPKFFLRLEHGAFRWPPISDGVMRLTASQLAALVDGMDWSRLYARDGVRPTATS